MFGQDSSCSEKKESICINLILGKRGLKMAGFVNGNSRAKSFKGTLSRGPGPDPPIPITFAFCSIPKKVPL